jgi:phosphoglycerol transferase MdoB-like AlkP superfamily enzyme
VEGFYSLNVAGDMTAGLSFLNDYLFAIRFGDLLYLLPIVTFAILRKLNKSNLDIVYCKTLHPLYLLVAFFITYTIAVSTIDDNDSHANLDNTFDITNISTLMSNSDKDLYTYMYNAKDALKKFGLLTYTQRDFFSLFYRNPLSKEAYNVLIDNYLNSKSDHVSNSYSNLFEGKNLILIQAESLDTYAFNDTLTPNLNRIKNDYAYFENFYSPLYYRSTADSEFMVQTSLFPDKNVSLSMEAYLHNTFPNTLPNMFKEKGYKTYSFHDYIDYFYPRGDFHLDALGYDQYWGSEELGMQADVNLDKLIINHQWQSDYEMMEMSIPKFINDDHFFVNYITVSGHFNYGDDHEMAKPEYVQAARDYLESLGDSVSYSEEIVYYLAVHMEVDKAFGYLLDQLEKYGKLDDTIIVIYGDHYAYGIDNDDIWAFDTEYKTDGDELDIHNVPMMIISPNNEFENNHSKYMSTIDVMPTLANLFGLNMNYKSAFGKDVFSYGNNVVHFSDGSFLSEQFRYESMKENVEIYDNSISPEFVYLLHEKFTNDYMYNILILQYNYFNNQN